MASDFSEIRKQCEGSARGSTSPILRPAGTTAPERSRPRSTPPVWAMTGAVRHLCDDLPFFNPVADRRIARHNACHGSAQDALVGHAAHEPRFAGVRLGAARVNGAAEAMTAIRLDDHMTVNARGEAGAERDDHGRIRQARAGIRLRHDRVHQDRRAQARPGSASRDRPGQESRSSAMANRAAATSSARRAWMPSTTTSVSYTASPKATVRRTMNGRGSSVITTGKPQR